MPPPPVILNDTVEQVTNALPPTLQRRFVTKSIITQTREALRLVQTKVPLGTLGKYDRQETRAAVLLDYVLRKQSSLASSNNNNNGSQQQQETTTIDLKHLAAVNGTKLAHFQTLHQTLGNYFHDIYHKHGNSNNNNKNNQQRKGSNSSSTSHRNTTSGRQKLNTRADDSNNGGGGVGARNLRHTSNSNSRSNANPRATTSTIATTTILPDLAIRLAGYLQNVHAVTVQAARLLHNMRDYSLLASLQQQQLSAVERRGQEYDYVRFWPAYEAAAFFVVATTWQNALHHHSGAIPTSMSSNDARRPSKKGKKSGATNTAAAAGNNTGGVLMATGDDEDIGGGQQQQPLQLRLEHLVAACNQFTLLQLKERLPHVQKVAALLVAAQQEKERYAQKQLQQQQQREDNSSKPARLIGTDATNAKSSKKRIKGKNEVTQTTSSKRGIVGNDGDNIAGDDDDAVLSLDRWAECILSEARARVQNNKTSKGEMGNQSESSNENKGDGDFDSLDQVEFWTRAAADQVLQKYNLLDVQQ